MTTRQKIAQELQMKEERVSAWENSTLSSGLMDRDFSEVPKIEYWYLEE